MNPSTQDFARLVQEAPDFAILVMEQDGTIASWNSGAEQLFGWSAEEAIGQHGRIIFTDEDRARGVPREELETALRTGRAGDHRWHIRKDGTRFWGSGVVTRLRSARGEILLTKIVQDLTELHEAEHALRQSEGRLQLLVDGVEEYAIFLMDSRGCITSWGKGAERIKGWKPEEIIGKHLSWLYPQGGAEDGTAEEHLRQAAETGEYVGEGLRLHKDGRLFPARVTMTALRRDGELVGFSKVTQDLTERRRYEAALRESEARYRQLAEAMPQLVWTAAPDGTPLYANRRWHEYTGVSIDRVEQMVHPEDAERRRVAWERALAAGEGYELDVRVRRHADGAWRYHHVHIVPMRDDTRLVGWLASLQDVQDRMDAAEALRHAQKLESIGVLAGGIAHDFNNLLTGVLGNASLAKRLVEADPLDRDQLANRIDSITRAAERAAQLTGQLLAYAGKGRLFVEPVDLCALVQEMTELLRASISRRVELVVDADGGCPPALADSAQVQQVIMNLVINAAEAIGERHGTVRVRVGSERLGIAESRGFQEMLPGLYLRLEVRDDGEGMAPETISRMFDPFFTTKFTGRGLGLAAVLGIVRGHRGGITVESEPGKGTTVTVLLPAADRPVEVAAAVHAPDRGTGRVLVVDDEESVRATVAAMLASAGYDVTLAENGREAVERLATGERFAAVLLDLTMPIMSGEQALIAIRSSAAPDVPVVVMSGYGEAQTLERFGGHRVDAFLQKPFDDTRLLEAVRRAITGRA